MNIRIWSQAANSVFLTDDPTQREYGSVPEAIDALIDAAWRRARRLNGVDVEHLLNWRKVPPWRSGWPSSRTTR